MNAWEGCNAAIASHVRHTATLPRDLVSESVVKDFFTTAADSKQWCDILSVDRAVMRLAG